MLEKAGVKVMLNELSSTVVFERPREEAFVRKWQVRALFDAGQLALCWLWCSASAGLAFVCSALLRSVGAYLPCLVQGPPAPPAAGRLLPHLLTLPASPPMPQLACEGDIAHVVVMPNITIRKLETFVQELVESR